MRRSSSDTTGLWGLNMAEPRLYLGQYGGDIVNLYDGVLQVNRRWAPSYADGSVPRIAESIPLIGRGTRAEIIAELGTLEGYFIRARNYLADTENRDPLCLSFKPEHDIRQVSLVHDGTAPQLPSRIHSTFLPEGTDIKLNLNLTRRNDWERSGFYNIGQIINNGLQFGATYTFASINGDIRARIPDFSMNVSTANLQHNFWIGIKDERRGITDFDPVLEAEDGTAGTDTSVVGSVTGASGSSVMRTTFAGTTTLAERFTLTIDQATSITNWDHYFGRYLVLGRLRVTGSASPKVGLQLRYGYPGSSGADHAPNTEVEVSDSNWRLVPLGYTRIPTFPSPESYSGNWARYFEFAIWAEKLAGTGTTLDFDAFCLIPTDAWAVGAGVDIGASDNISIITRPDGLHVVYTGDASTLTTRGDTSFKNWSLSTGTSKLVVAMETISSGQVISSTLDVDSFEYIPRTRAYIDA